MNRKLIIIIIAAILAITAIMLIQMRRSGSGGNLATDGRQVTVVEMLGEIAADMYESMRGLMLISLNELGVRVRTGTTATAISGNGVTVDCNGKQELITADTVVLALGAGANQELAGKLENLASDLYTVGDCVEARKLPNAVEDGFKVASRI